MYSIGACIAGAMPTSYLKNLSPSDFVAYFSNNVGLAFQPDDDQTQVVQAFIAYVIN